MKTVFTNGCFEILHAGHIDLLQRAKMLGDILIVGLNSDESVRKLKGEKACIQPESLRAMSLMALRCVDRVIIFNETTVCRLLRELNPTFWVKGGDYTFDTLARSEVEVADEIGAEIILLRTKIHLHTSEIVGNFKDNAYIRSEQDS